MKWIWAVGAGALALAAAALLRRLRSLAAIGAGYKARMLCSGVFVSGRTPAAVLSEDLSSAERWVLKPFTTRVDPHAGRVTASVLGLVRRQAVYRPGLGCTLLLGGARLDGAPAPAPPAPGPWPGGEHPDGRLSPLLDWAFAEPDPARPRRTRALVVVQGGRIVAERYAPGFGAATPLLGWSLAKSVMNALAGILVGQGRLHLDAPVALPEWSSPEDPRRTITLDHLLRMSSGLSFQEDYADPLADVTRMLLADGDAAAFAARKPLSYPPGSRWHYASGTSNLISRLFREVLEEGEYASFPREALFGPLGMESAVLEPDLAGTFLGSSFLYASARDWARFGALYLQDGVWEGRRILPEGWVAYTRTPAPADSDRRYGAHFWLELPQEYRSAPGPDGLPADTFYAVGHEGQLITVIPSRELVVVRLGLTRETGGWPHDRFLGRLLETLAVPP